MLGICYGMHALAHQLGGKVVPADEREYGHAVLNQGDVESPIFDGMPPSMPVWMSHGDRITQLPPGFQSIAYSDNSPFAAMSDGKNVFGIQFHPEVVHTPHGKQVIENFLYKVCGLHGDWTPGNFIADGINRIRKQIGDGKVICALSGGVDSAVAATLVTQGRRRPAHLHLRRQRPYAPRGAGARRRHVRPPYGDQTRPRRCGRALPDAA